MDPNLLGTWRLKWSQKGTDFVDLAHISRGRLPQMSVRVRPIEQRIRPNRLDNVLRVHIPNYGSATWIDSADIVYGEGTELWLRFDEMALVPDPADRRIWEDELDIPLPWRGLLMDDEKDCYVYDCGTLGRKTRIVHQNPKCLLVKVPGYRSRMHPHECTWASSSKVPPLPVREGLWDYKETRLA